MIALYIFGIIFVILLIYLVIIIFFPVLKVEKQPIVYNTQKNEIPDCREDISFTVNGEYVKGYLYLPEEKPTACIIMNHGFCGTKDMGLEKYALRFMKVGFATLTYDYRHFGESEGYPRQLYNRLLQLDDIRGAIKYVRARNEIDENKVIIWGTSAGGSHGISIASEDHKIAGVIVQCASLDHKEDDKVFMEREGFGFFLKIFMHGQRDKGRSRFGLSVHNIPAYGKPGTTALITAPGVYEGISELAKHSKLFKNEMCGRTMLLPQGKDPLNLVANVECPVQILVCKKDEIVSPKSHLKLVDILKDKANVIEYDIGHFDIYLGKDFEKAIADQIHFIKNVLNK